MYAIIDLQELMIKGKVSLTHDENHAERITSSVLEDSNTPEDSNIFGESSITDYISFTTDIPITSNYLT